MKITVVGGGNIGTQFMVHCAEKGHDVIAYTSKPEVFDTQLKIVDEYGKTSHEGSICFATNDPQTAFADAELIMVTLPPTMMQSLADAVYKFGNSKSIIGVVPGNGGSECAFSKCIERGNVFFALERVPAIARLIEKGKVVKSTGYRNELHISSIPIRYADSCCKIIESIYDIPCRVIPCFLNLTMTPSNPILHTTRLKSVFKDYEFGRVYDKLPLFYEEWDDNSSELLILCDKEVQNICKALPEFHLEFVKSLQEHYESNTVEKMTQKISGIPAFKGLTTPSLKAEGGYIPDFNSRYFTSDFSYGLTIIKQIAEMAGVDTPNIDATMKWYEKFDKQHNSFNFKDYGIYMIDDLKNFYLR